VYIKTFNLCRILKKHVNYNVQLTKISKI